LLGSGGINLEIYGLRGLKISLTAELLLRDFKAKAYNLGKCFLYQFKFWAQKPQIRLKQHYSPRVECINEASDISY
jgi:hypothetical protein